MDVKEIMGILEEMGVAVFASVDDKGLPHARHIHIGVANEHGVFFMTGPHTGLFEQMSKKPEIAITAMQQEDYLIQVIRIEGKVRPVGPELLQDLLKDNPYVEYVYPSLEEQEEVRVFQLYQGRGFYHSLTQGHKYVFAINDPDYEGTTALT